MISHNLWEEGGEEESVVSERGSQAKPGHVRDPSPAAFDFRVKLRIMSWNGRTDGQTDMNTSRDIPLPPHLIASSFTI